MLAAQSYQTPSDDILLEMQDVLDEYHRLLREMLGDSAEKYIEFARELSIHICILVDKYDRGIQNFMQCITIDLIASGSYEFANKSILEGESD